jgi:hypothetical protein
MTDSTTAPSPDFLPLTPRRSLTKEEWASELSDHFKAAGGVLKTWGVVGILVDNSDLEETEPGSGKYSLVKSLELSLIPEGCGPMVLPHSSS